MRCCLLLVVLHATSTVLHSVVEMRLHKQCYCSAPPVHRESLGNAGGRTRGITIPNDARPALSVGSRNANLNGRRRTRPAAAKISASPQFLLTIVCARDPFQAVDVNQVELLRCQSGEPCYTMPCHAATLPRPRGFMGTRACAYMKLKCVGGDLIVFERVNCLLKTFKPHTKRWCGWFMRTHEPPSLQPGSGPQRSDDSNARHKEAESNRMSRPHEPAETVTVWDRESTRRPNFKRQATHFPRHKAPQFHPHGGNLMTHQRREARGR